MTANFTLQKSILKTYDDLLLDHETTFRTRAELDNQISFNFSWDNSHKASFEGTPFKDVKDYNFGMGYNPSERFYTRLNYSWGDSIARNVDQPTVGERKIIVFTFLIVGQINLELNTIIEKIHSPTKILEKKYFLGT